MKAIAKVLMIVGVSVAGMGLAQAETQLVAADSAVTSDICVVAAEGNKMKLHKAIKDAGLTRNYVASNVQCNDMPIVEFVEQYGENVASINRYITAGEYTGQLISQITAK
ncbi:DUF3718 domain-containing protein [Aestuariibacter sp. GS-14]|uniref:DUF3718 domain-containing protein n=1 Tax=Alteromonadaceae TaxID=72275 RepID=UPI0015E84925|nr:DUF3718 domain-containing protein [Aestuariibacter sp. GS-14]